MYYAIDLNYCKDRLLVNEVKIMNDKIRQLKYEIELEKEKIVTEKHTKFLEAMRKQVQEEEKFRVELLEEYGVTNHPKVGLAYSMAWERGHSNGFEQVRSEFEDLVELIT